MIWLPCYWEHAGLYAAQCEALLSEIEMRRLLSKHETAERLGFHPEHVMRLARQGKFPRPFKLGDKPNCAVRWDEADIEAWLDARRAAV